MGKVIVTVDSHEPNSLVRDLKGFGATVYKRTLKLGDIELPHDRVERKKMSDFENAVTQNRANRLYSQVERLTLATDKRPWLIITGDITERRTKATNENIYGAMASVYVRYGIPVLWVQNDTMLAYLVARVIWKLGEGKAYKPRRRPSMMGFGKANTLANFVGAPLDVGKRLLRQHNDNTWDVLTYLKDTSEKQIKKDVRGLGPARIKKIKTILR